MKPRMPPPANNANNHYPPSTYAASSVYAPSEAPQSPRTPPMQHASFGPTATYLNDASESTYAESICPGPSAHLPRQEPLKYSRDRPPSSSFAPTARYLDDIPESTYAESIYPGPSALPTLPSTLQYTRAAPPPLSFQDSMQLQYYQQPPSMNSCISKAHYYLQPATTSREPALLYNRNCGAKYKTVGAVVKADAILFRHLMESEQMVMMQVLAGMYRYRMNCIIRKGKLKAAEIRGIFSCDITDYQFSLHELYKRFAMRKGQLLGKKARDYNFWALPPKEMDKWRNWLKRVGSWRPRAGKKYTLWTLGKDDHGLLYLKLQLNEVTLNYLQLLNAIYDSLIAWRELDHGPAYIKQATRTPAFEFC